MFPDSEYNNWLGSARTLAVLERRRLGIHPIKGPCEADFEFRIFSKIHAKDEFHEQRPDRSNLLKSAEDAIKEIIIHDDCQIYKGQTTKVWVESAIEEGVYVTIRYWY